MLSSIDNYIKSAIEWRYFPVLFILLLSAFSLIVTPGYESFTSDQALFLPPLYHLLDQTLFPDDVRWWNEMFTNQTFLTDFLAFFVQHGMNIFWTLFTLTALSRVLFFTALYFIVRGLAGSRGIALITLLFFLTPFWVPGTGHTTIENAFSYRAITLPLGLTATAFILRNRYLLASAPLVLGFMIHPITALPFLLFYYGMIGKEMWLQKLDLLRLKNEIAAFLITTTALGLFTLLYSSGAAENFFIVIDDQWKALAHPRNSPAFFAFWDKNSYLSLAAWILLGVTFYQKAKQQLTPLARFVYVLTMSIPLFFLGVAAVGEYTAWHGLLKLNFQRGIFFFNIFIPIFIAAYTFRDDIQNRTSLEERWLLFSIIAWFFWKENFVFLREQMLLFIPSLLILFAGKHSPPLANRERLRAILAVGALFLLSGAAANRAIFYADYLSFGIFILIMIVGFLAAMYFQVPSRKEYCLQYGIGAAILLLTAGMSARAPSFTIYPHFHYNAAYQEACRWVENHTTRDSVFIVEPFISDPPEEFRLACFRSIFTTFKDGGIIPYNPSRQDAFDWKRRYDLIYAIRGNWNTIETIKQSYRVDYIFSEEELPIHFPLAFSNNKYHIYDIR